MNLCSSWMEDHQKMQSIYAKQKLKKKNPRAGSEKPLPYCCQDYGPGVNFWEPLLQII